MQTSADRVYQSTTVCFQSPAPTSSLLAPRLQSVVCGANCQSTFECHMLCCSMYLNIGYLIKLIASLLPSLLIYRLLGYERVYLPLYKGANTPFHIRGNDVCETDLQR